MLGTILLVSVAILLRLVAAVLRLNPGRWPVRLVGGLPALAAAWMAASAAGAWPFVWPVPLAGVIYLLVALRLETSPTSYKWWLATDIAATLLFGRLALPPLAPVALVGVTGAVAAGGFALDWGLARFSARARMAGLALAGLVCLAAALARPGTVASGLSLLQDRLLPAGAAPALPPAPPLPAGGYGLKVRLIPPPEQPGLAAATLSLYPAGQAGGEVLAMRRWPEEAASLPPDGAALSFNLGSHPAVDLVVEFADGSTVTRRHVAAGQTVVINGAGPSLDMAGRQWAPYLEWTLENPDVSGNPYDLVATVTFVHSDSGERRTTEMFYDGGNLWKFRFTGTRPGRWTFTTASSDADLAGHSGTVTIEPNPGVAGFVTHFGNKWGRLGTDEAFVPQLVMYSGPQGYYNNPAQIEADIQTFLVEHGFNGFHTPVFCRWFDITRRQCSRINNPDPNPDPRTFEALELLITRVHAAGGVVHIWAWGDDSRSENPKRWGLNGAADRRLQRYLAARLGPLPGWTIGYGYDLWEWVNGGQLTEWHDYMQAHLGWPHYLGARAQTNRLSQLSEAMDYASYEQHKPTYDLYVQTIEARPGKPAFSEDRFRIRDEGRAKDYSMEETRRGLWRSTMAGGVANIWGNLIGAGGANDGTGASAPYPNPEQIKTYARFFAGRFTKDLARCNELTGGVCLKGANQARFIFYKEDATAIELDLSGMAGAQPAVAVDTKLAYAEINLGLLAAEQQTWQAPYPSDWAIAVGNWISR